MPEVEWYYRKNTGFGAKWDLSWEEQGAKPNSFPEAFSASMTAYTLGTLISLVSYHALEAFRPPRFQFLMELGKTMSQEWQLPFKKVQKSWWIHTLPNQKGGVLPLLVLSLLMFYGCGRETDCSAYLRELEETAVCWKKNVPYVPGGNAGFYILVSSMYS